MLPSSSLLVNYLRKISLNTMDLRLQRAVLVGQLLAYKAPIHSMATLEEVYAKTEAKVKRILGEVNEECILDIGLALRMYSAILQTRITLISNPLQLDAIRAVLESETLSKEAGGAASELMTQLASNNVQMMLTAQTAGQLEVLTED